MPSESEAEGVGGRKSARKQMDKHEEGRTKLIEKPLICDFLYSRSLLPSRRKRRATSLSEGGFKKSLCVFLWAQRTRGTFEESPPYPQTFLKKEDCRKHRINASLREVNEQKQLIIVFAKCLTEIRRNEANL